MQISQRTAFLVVCAAVAASATTPAFAQVVLIACLLGFSPYLFRGYAMTLTRPSGPNQPKPLGLAGWLVSLAAPGLLLLLGSVSTELLGWYGLLPVSIAAFSYISLSLPD